jgi:hypothetical protein
MYGSRVALCDEAESFIFSSPILYRPMLEKARSQYDANKPEIQNIPEFKILVELEKRTLGENEKDRFDESMLFRYPEENIDFHLFIKDRLIMEIWMVSTNDQSKKIFQRDIGFINRNIPEAPPEYLRMNEEAVKAILTGEDFLCRLPPGKNFLTVKIALDGKVAVGNVALPSASDDQHHFWYNDNVLKNSALLSKTEADLRIRYSVTFIHNVITMANVYNNGVTDGFDCAFYENQGLKYYLPKTKGAFDQITTWDMNGKNKTIQPWEAWLKKQR